MLPEQQQRILGYFIEEAKDHLNTIEPGLLSLQSTLKDSEIVNEIFRAAHSIKGGAAMLGLDNIQRTAHLLEDCFKLLKECPSIQVDQKLESLFLQVFDNLQSLLQHLEESSGLTEDVANNLMSDMEPIFEALHQHLEMLVNHVGDPGAQEQENADSLLQVFQSQVLQKLREMLQLFKQLETQQNRQQLQECCDQLARVGEQFNLEGWQRLCETVSGAIANAENKYHSLAPIVIKDLKQSQELVLAGNDAQIRTSEQLQALSIPTFTKSSDSAPSLHGETVPPPPDISALAESYLEGFPPSKLFKRVEPEGAFSLPLWEGDNISISVELADQNSAINDLSNLFAIGASDRTPLQDENNSLWQDTTELEIVDSLFDDPVETSTSESIFSDLFDRIEDTEESLDLSEVSAQDNLTKSSDSAPSLHGGVSLTADADLIDLWYQEFESDLETADIPEVAVSRLENFLETEATQNHLNDFTELEILLGEEVALDSEVTIIPQTLLNLDTPTLEPALSDAAPLSDVTDLGIAATTTDEPIIAALTAKPAAGVNRRRQDLGPTMRVPVKQLNDVSNLVGELIVNRNSLEQDQKRLRQFLDKLLHQVQQLGDLGAKMQQLYERSLLETSLLTSRQPSGFALPSETTATNTSRHATGIDFDALEMDRFTNFHTLSQEMIELIVRVRESSSDIEFITDETDQVARQFRQVTTQLQEGLTRSRMIPFSTITDRLPRAVRDIAIKYGKQAELEIVGQDTLIDKMILEQLYDPMTHLVNNAITHGIETPEERQRLKKSPVGKIVIRAFHQGNQTIVSVTDDGAGIDVERVKTKALSQGLIVPSGLAMSRMDVYALLFHPGFSTKDQADDYAGRGIGMDVVQTSLNEIRGTITTDSTQAVGTTFTIRLPLTLSICKALCCLSDKARIAFPMDGVEDTLDIPASEVVMSEEGQSFIRWRNSLLRFRPLKELLRYNRQLSRGNFYGGNREDDMISIVVLRSSSTFIALQVDQVLSEQEIVIKQFESPVPKPIGMAGATVMGNGRVMPIADVLELIDLFNGVLRKETSLWANSSASMLEATPATKTEPMVLIVDDSITVRELLSLTFNKAGYRVEQARDGQEAWEKLRDGLPCNLVFCDIEMPKMDGLELLSRIQKDPALNQLPVAMLTSRGAERHRQMALQLGARGYFTKPYLEEALLEAAMRMLK